MFLCINIKYKYICAIYNGELMKAHVRIYIYMYLTSYILNLAVSFDLK